MAWYGEKSEISPEELVIQCRTRAVNRYESNLKNNKKSMLN